MLAADLKTVWTATSIDARLKKRRRYRHRYGMTDQALYEYAAILPAAGQANRSRRPTECAKDSGRHPTKSDL